MKFWEFGGSLAGLRNILKIAIFALFLGVLGANNLFSQNNQTTPTQIQDNDDFITAGLKDQARSLLGLNRGVFLGNKAMIFYLFCAIVVAFGLFYFIQKRRKNILFKRSKSVLKPFYESKIETRPAAHPRRDGDLVREISFYFPMLYRLCAKNNNTLLFSYDTAFERYFNADFHTFLYLIHGVGDFFATAAKQSVIKIEFKKLASTPESLNFHISITIYSDFTEHSLMIRESIEGQNRNIFYKKLSLACFRAKLLGANMRYFSNKDNGELVFDIAFSPVLQKSALKFESKKPLNVLISESSEHSYNLLKSQLENWGVRVAPNSEWEIVWRHLKDMIYTPQILFIQADIIMRLNKEILTELKRLKDKKNIAIVLISNNERTAKVCERLRFKSYILQQPYTTDTLLGILYETMEQNLWNKS